LEYYKNSTSIDKIFTTFGLLILPFIIFVKHKYTISYNKKTLAFFIFLSIIILFNHFLGNLNVR